KHDPLARAARVDGLRLSCDPERANQKQYQLRRLQSVGLVSASLQVAWKGRHQKRARSVLARQVIPNGPRRPCRDLENFRAIAFGSSPHPTFLVRWLQLHTLIDHSPRSIHYQARWKRDNRA